MYTYSNKKHTYIYIYIYICIYHIYIYTIWKALWFSLWVFKRCTTTTGEPNQYLKKGDAVMSFGGDTKLPKCDWRGEYVLNKRVAQ